MRKAFVEIMLEIMEQDQRVALLLGDIGVYAFREAFARWPDRVYNVGIREQAMIGMAAGLAHQGFIPVVHSIAPFVVERCYEQLKIDACYQRLPIKIVSVGASYDYPKLGYTHHCPGDVWVLSALPNMRIMVPGSAAEFKMLFRETYERSGPAYYRLSEQQNNLTHTVNYGRAVVLKRGTLGTVLAVGPALGPVASVWCMDLTVLYYTTVRSLDTRALMKEVFHPKLLIVEPYMSGPMLHRITDVLRRPMDIRCLGVNKPVRHYGTMEDHDKSHGLLPEQIKRYAEAFFYETY